jgi:hypothetical protein
VKRAASAGEVAFPGDLEARQERVFPLQEETAGEEAGEIEDVPQGERVSAAHGGPHTTTARPVNGILACKTEVIP